MILLLLQPADNYDGHDPLHALYPDGHPAAVDRVLASLVGPQTELGCEGGLVARELAVQEPAAGAEAQHGAPLALDPGLVVGLDAGPRGRLEEDEAAGQCDGDEGRLGGVEEARVQEVAELVGVSGGEGREGEGVAFGGQGVDL